MTAFSAGDPSRLQRGRPRDGLTRTPVRGHIEGPSDERTFDPDNRTSRRLMALAWAPPTERRSAPEREPQPRPTGAVQRAGGPSDYAGSRSGATASRRDRRPPTGAAPDRSTPGCRTIPGRGGPGGGGAVGSHVLPGGRGHRPAGRPRRCRGAEAEGGLAMALATGPVPLWQARSPSTSSSRVTRCGRSPLRLDPGGGSPAGR